MTERTDRFTRGLGIRPRHRHYKPFEHLVEVLKARVADPAILIKRAVAFVENLRIIFHHELGPAELAVIVIPVGIPGVASVIAPAEFDALQVLFLAL